MAKAPSGGSKARAVVIGVLGAAAALAVTQYGFPEPTPGAYLFRGFVFGMLSAITAAALVLVYRSGRFINFAQGALGTVGAVFAYRFAVIANWPFLLAMAAGLIVATATGIIVELGIIRRFANSPRLALTVVTIALAGLLPGASGFIDRIQIFGDVADLSQEETLGTATITNIPFPDFRFEISGFPLQFGFVHILTIGLSALALIGLTLFLRYSRSGVAIRAAAENSERTPLLGISTGRLSLIVWAIAGLLSGLALILGGTVAGVLTVQGGSLQVLVAAFAAAVLGSFQSFPIAIGSAITLSVFGTAFSHAYPENESLFLVGLFVLILVGLTFQRGRSERSESHEISSWKAVEEYRTIPKEMNEVGPIRLWRFVFGAVALLALIIFPFAADTRLTILGGQIAITAIVMLSLVLLTGWAGQVSLGQFAFVAIGAVVGGAMTSRMGISFWLAIFIVPVITAALSALIGASSLRIRGLYLGITTFAFAFVVEAVLFKDEYFGWILPESVDRPTLLILDFQDERSMYFLTLVGLLLAILILTRWRKSRVGRILIALRENETNVQSFGVNLLRTKLSAFALSGLLCGFAGFLLAHQARAVQVTDFPAQLSLDVFLYAVIGGVGSVAGALMGATYLALVSLLQNNQQLAFLFGPLALVAILYISPGGLAALFLKARDGVLRIIAQRRQMIVPALFADIDPDALARRLIPLGEPISGSGLSALSLDHRYQAVSGIYGAASWLNPRTVGVGRDQDEQALGAAAEAAGEEIEVAIPASEE